MLKPLFSWIYVKKIILFSFMEVMVVHGVEGVILLLMGFMVASIIVCMPVSCVSSLCVQSSCWCTKTLIPLLIFDHVHGLNIWVLIFMFLGWHLVIWISLISCTWVPLVYRFKSLKIYMLGVFTSKFGHVLGSKSHATIWDVFGHILMKFKRLIHIDKYFFICDA